MAHEVVTNASLVRLQLLASQVYEAMKAEIDKAGPDVGHEPLQGRQVLWAMVCFLAVHGPRARSRKWSASFLWNSCRIVMGSFIGPRRSAADWA
ncbi:MAG: hypothetical protein K0R61_297 [Microvirga sp.]|jgi:hypothetical protein|nr:hypothetical protein [Microvirga sp.]MDF2969847.1 hypothetical protein [Microvirga sp.]